MFFYILCLCELTKQLIYSYSPKKRKEKIQKRNFRKLINNAYQIPFYREKFDRANIKPKDIKTFEDLRKLPLISKDEYREWVDNEKNKKSNKYCYIAKTSGSSGKPLEVINTPREYAADIMNVLRTWIVCGYNPMFNVTVTELDSSSAKVAYKTLIQKLGILRRECINESDSEEEIIKQINRFKPGLIHMYKSEFVKISKYAQENNLKVHMPKYYSISGEHIDSISKRVMEKTFGKKLICIYGCVEGGTVAYVNPNSNDNSYIINKDMFMINIDYSDSENTNKGKIILTTLYKDKFPLINYNVGDYAITENNEDGVAIKQILGRENDSIKTKDGKTIGWIHLWYIVTEEQDIYQVRFIQESYTEITVELSAKKNSRKSLLEIEKSITYKFDKAFKKEFILKFKWYDCIPSDKNGKTRMIISKI